jgi:N-acetylglucosamine transport system permease protein
LPRVILYAALIFFTLLVVVPVGWAVLNSLKRAAEFASGKPWALPKSLYLANYASAWVGARMGDYFLNTVLLTALSLAILLIVSVPCAYVLSRFKFRGARILDLLIMAGIFINVNYNVIPLYTMVNGVGRFLRIRMLADNAVVVSLIYAGTSVSFSVYLLCGFFRTLSTAFEEAAKIDGCGDARMLLTVVAPLIMPSVVIVLLFNFLKFWNEYLIAVTFLTTTAKWTLPIGLLDLMEVERLAGDRGRMFAGLTIMLVPTVAFFIAVQDKLMKGMTLGGIKG